jgi:predicted Zn-dependent protease
MDPPRPAGDSSAKTSDHTSPPPLPTEKTSPEEPPSGPEGQTTAAPEEAEADEETPTEEESRKESRTRPRRIVLDTVYDDARVGNEQTSEIEAELGLVDDEALERYLNSVAVRLMRHAPPRPFDWEFKIIDQSVPNAFALPGGKIYVSRGLLALVQSEDELAGVIGHEITHSAERHAAARIDYASRINPFSIGLMRAASIAAYGRDQERDADRGGQLLAARAGYDPKGIATFLRKLDASERYHVGWSRLPNFLATHPSSPERSAIASDRAAGLSWERKDGIADNLSHGYYSAIDGLVLGDDPAGGLFEGSRFVHPDLGFSVRFPQGWETMNSQQAVGARSPGRDARATLTVEGSGEDLDAAVDDFLAGEAQNLRILVRGRQKIMLGERPAIRVEADVAGSVSLRAQMTFVIHDDLVYRLSLVSVSRAANEYRGRARAFAQSFRALDEAGTHSLKVTRLRIARSLENESLKALSERTRNELDLVYTGVMNGAYAMTRFTRGTPVKIGLAEPYMPKPRDEGGEGSARSKPDSDTAPDSAGSGAADSGS